MTHDRPPQRILFAAHGFPPEETGGTESYVRDLAVLLIAAGRDVRVVAGSMTPADAPLAAHGTVDGVQIARLRRASLHVDHWAKSDDPSIESLWRAEIESFKPDVVHVHHWIRLTRRLVVVAAELGVPSIVTLHDAATTCPRAFRVRDEMPCDLVQGAAACFGCAAALEGADDADLRAELDAYAADFAEELRAATIVVAPSAAHRDAIAPHLPIAASDVRVIEHGPLSIAPKKIRRGRRGADAPLRLGHWGHLAPHKGTHLILEAVRRLPEALRSRCEVILRGVATDDVYEARLVALSDGLKVKRDGAFSPADLSSLAFDLAILPSLARESFSFVLDEAFALGVPAIVARHGALAERVGDAGTSFRPGDADDLASKIAAVINDPEVLATWRAAIPKPRSAKAHVETLGALYDEAAKIGPRRPVETRSDDAPRRARLAAALERRTSALVDARARVDAERNRADGAAEALRGAEQSVATLRDRLAEKAADLDRHVASISDLRAALAAKTADVAGFERSVDDLRRIVAAKDATIEEFRKSVAAHEAEAERRGRDLAAFETSTVQLKAALEAKESDLARFQKSALEWEATFRRKDADVAEFRKSVEDLSVALRRKEKDVEGFEASVAELTAALARKTEDVAGFETSVAQLSDALRRKDADLEAFARSAAELRAQLDAARAHANALEKTTAEQKASIASKDASIAALDRIGRELRETLIEREKDGAVLREALAKKKEEAAAFERASNAFRATAEVKTEEARAAEAAYDVETARTDAWRARALGAEAAAAAAVAREASVRAENRETEANLRAATAEAASMKSVLEASARLLGVGSDPTDLGAIEAGAAAARRGLDAAAEYLRLRRNDPAAASALQKVEERRRLRILTVIHDFLPYHAAGSEIYAYETSKALAARHDVRLVFCENRPERPQYEAREGVFDGLPFTEIVHHDAWPSFESTWKDAAMERAFDRVLDSFQPDVVHFQHWKFFGVGCFERARRRGAAVLTTLHEYLLLCPRDGQMLRADGERCLTPVVSKCSDCVEHRAIASGIVPSTLRAIGRGLSGAPLAPDALRRFGTRLERAASVRFAKRSTPPEREAALERRLDDVKRALKHVDLPMAPSRFLLDRFVASGVVAPDRAVHWPYGHDHARFKAKARTTSETLRVGYLGTLSAYKGVSVLVDALNLLADAPVEGRLHGAPEIFPDFVAALRERIKNPRTRLMGRFDNRRVGDLLSEIDVLVVPSLWWENAPLTISEAFLAGVPVIASDIGGMAEMVRDGVDGALVPPGDAAALAAAIRRFVDDRSLLLKLRPKAENVRDVREDAAKLEAAMFRILDGRKSGEGPR